MLIVVVKVAHYKIKAWKKPFDNAVFVSQGLAFTGLTEFLVLKNIRFHEEILNVCESFFYIITS